MAIKWITWKKWDRFLEKFNLPRLNQEEIEIMSNPIISTEIETVIKISQKIKSPGPDRWILPNIWRRASTYSSKAISKTCRGRNTFKLILQGHHHPDNPISLMNIDTKILNKILEIEFRNTFKKLIHHDQVGFIPGMQGFFNICKLFNVIYHINKLKDKKDK